MSDVAEAPPTSELAQHVLRDLAPSLSCNRRRPGVMRGFRSSQGEPQDLDPTCRRSRSMKERRLALGLIPKP